MKYLYENKGMRVESQYTTKLEFQAHLHSHIELALLLEGEACAVVDSVEYPLRSGDALLVFPNQIHKFGKDSIRKCVICIFPPQICPELRAVFEAKVPKSPVIPDAASCLEAVQILRRIEEINRTKPPNMDLLNRGYLTALLGELFAFVEFTGASPAGSNAMRDIIQYCQSHFMENVQLNVLAKELHISRHYISHLFSGKLHMRFRDYIGMLRVSEAQRLLGGSDLSVTDIAYQVGFHSLRSFNRVFSKHVGTTPRDYRRQAVLER